MSILAGGIVVLVGLSLWYNLMDHFEDKRRAKFEKEHADVNIPYYD